MPPVHCTDTMVMVRPTPQASPTHPAMPSIPSKTTPPSLAVHLGKCARSRRAQTGRDRPRAKTSEDGGAPPPYTPHLILLFVHCLLEPVEGPPLPEYLEHHNTGRVSNIDRVLHSKHRNLTQDVCQVEHISGHARHFIAEHDSRLRRKGYLTDAKIPHTHTHRDRQAWSWRAHGRLHRHAVGSCQSSRAPLL